MPGRPPSHWPLGSRFSMQRPAVPISPAQSKGQWKSHVLQPRAASGASGEVTWVPALQPSTLHRAEEQGRRGQSKAEEGRSGQSRAEEGRAGQRRAQQGILPGAALETCLRSPSLGSAACWEVEKIPASPSGSRLKGSGQRSGHPTAVHLFNW